MNYQFTIILSHIVILYVHIEPRTDWFAATQQELREALQLRPNLNKAKNVIFFLGDGLGLSTVTASRIYNAQKKGVSFTEAQLSFEKLPHAGLLRVRLCEASK